MLEARDAVADDHAAAAPSTSTRACSGGIITAGALGHLAARGPARRGREPDADGRARSTTSAPGTARRVRQPRDGRRRGRRVGPARLPRRPGARRRVHVAAAQRPGLELRRQQLPARQGAAGVRRPVLEPGHRAPGRRPAPRLHPPRRSTTRSRAPAALDGARHAGRPRRGRRRQLHRRRPHRPHRPVGERLPQHAAARRRRRASCSRPAATSRRSSTRRRRTRARATASPTSTPADPQALLEQAATVPGSWWPDYVEWLAARSGALRPAPKRLGGRGHRALGKAPGTYVHASVISDDAHAHALPAPRRGAGDRLLPRPRAVHRRAVGALPAHAALRRRGGAARDQRVLGARGAGVAAVPPPGRARPRTATTSRATAARA